MELDRKGLFFLMGLQRPGNSCVVGVGNCMLHNVGYSTKPTACEPDNSLLLQAWDDATGKGLDAGMVQTARQEEVAYIHKPNHYTKVPRSKALALKAKIISVRWLDINKGDATTPNYRSRLVAREIKRDVQTDLFAATPPLEAMKIVISLLASSDKGEN